MAEMGAGLHTPPAREQDEHFELKVFHKCQGVGEEERTQHYICQAAHLQLNKWVKVVRHVAA